MVHDSMYSDLIRWKKSLLTVYIATVIMIVRRNSFSFLEVCDMNREHGTLGQCLQVWLTHTRCPNCRELSVYKL